MDILYQGEINVHNDFNEEDINSYQDVCNKIWSRIEKNPSLDISQLTLKDLQE